MIVDYRRGDRGMVWLNGQEVKKPRRARTGVRGYVDAVVFVNGQAQMDGNGNLRIERLKGRVQFRRFPNNDYIGYLLSNRNSKVLYA